MLYYSIPYTHIYIYIYIHTQYSEFARASGMCICVAPLSCLMRWTVVPFSCSFRF